MTFGMNQAVVAPNHPTEPFAARIRRAVIWRSGSQITAQGLQWAATFLVIRILPPSDYGLFAMTQVVMVLLGMLNGYGLASGLVQAAEVTPRQVRQLWGMLLLLNAGLAAAQLALAPLAAAYYRQPLVADMLRVQALVYLATPLIALPSALLSRAMDFRHQAAANISASVAGASVALGGALMGWGVWTLVWAPISLFWVRGLVLATAARAWAWPVFDFRGAGHLARYGGVMAVGQVTWFAQSQADVFVAGRHLSPQALGLYTTGLFLTQIFVSKIVPPLNEVAFSAYARLQAEGRAVGPAFLRTLRVVSLAGLPFSLGLAASAGPFVLTVLGPRWAGTIPVVRLLALAMPFMTWNVLLSPASDARGRPGVGVANGAVGSVLLAAGFLIGVHWGATGLAAAWIGAYPLYLAASLWRTLPVLEVNFADCARTVAAPLAAAGVMALSVVCLDAVLSPMAPAARLALLVTSGATVYAGLLALWARETVTELTAMVRGR